MTKRDEYVEKLQQSGGDEETCRSVQRAMLAYHASEVEHPRDAARLIHMAHVFSSLSENFLEQYAHTMADADVPVVYFNLHTLAHKKLPALSTDQVKNAFADERIRVFNDPVSLTAFIRDRFRGPSVLLMMSSGTFDGVDLDTF